MNLEKLKDSARKFEQKEDWRKAIDVYLKAIQQIESGSETSPDLSLYNRVGDLYLKTNDTAAAVRSYERAVDLYADQGFFNNAIALCGKILRVNPGRTQTYLKLAQLHARKNVVIEAKRNLIEFLERMNALGQLDQAFQSVKEFADQFSGSQEIRMMLVELLRAASREDEAREQLDKLTGELETHRPAGPEARTADIRPAGQTGTDAARESAPRRVGPAATPSSTSGLVFLDTGFNAPAVEEPAGAPVHPEAPPVAPPEGLMVTESLYAGEQPTGELIIDPLQPSVGQADEADAGAAVPGLERTPELDIDTGALAEANAALDLERVAPAELELEGLPPEPLLDATDELLGLEEVGAAPAEVVEGENTADLELDLAGEVPVDEATLTADLPMIPVEARAPTIAELESRVLDDPDNPELHRELADRLLLSGESVRGIEELELALAGFESREQWYDASTLADRLVALAPTHIRHHQKRVELAYRTGDRNHLLDAYLALGDTLVRLGATDKAIAVYGRVQEHDPDNVRAAEALEMLRLQSEIEAEVSEPEPPRASPPAAPAPPTTPGAKAAATAAASSAPSPLPPPPESGTPARDGSFVDLGSMVLDASAPRDTRMRIDRREPQDEDEQREFKEILEQFKRGIEQNLDSEDYQAHYDLGIAFKEMGLFDEAIAEFQKALRSPEGRLRTSEALGICFFEKRQYAIAETVLRRAVESVEGGDDAKIGLLYWLGRALEAQRKQGEALGSYERALAVDIRFMDLNDRIQRLTAARE